MSSNFVRQCETAVMAASTRIGSKVCGFSLKLLYVRMKPKSSPVLFYTLLGRSLLVGATSGRAQPFGKSPTQSRTESESPVLLAQIPNVQYNSVCTGDGHSGNRPNTWSEMQIADQPRWRCAVDVPEAQAPAESFVRVNKMGT